MGADAVMVGSPLARADDALVSPDATGAWKPLTQSSPRGEVVELRSVGSLEEVLLGPSHTSDGTMNLVGGFVGRWRSVATAISGVPAC